MRTVNDIVGAVQESEPATEEELRLALLCLYYDLQLACPSDFGSVSPAHSHLRAKENFERRFRMLKSDPTVWLGERYTPGTSANAEGRAASKRILAAFEKSREPTKETP